jgi:hypothetical protein
MPVHAKVVLAICGSQDHGWFFALSFGGRLAYGPLALDDVGLPRLRDLSNYLPDRMPSSTLVSAVPARHASHLEEHLTRSLMFAGSRIHVYPLTATDVATVLGLPVPSQGAFTSTMPSLEDLRPGLAESLQGVEVRALEDGVVIALSHLLAGVEAHRAWLRRFGGALSEAAALRVLPETRHCSPVEYRRSVAPARKDESATELDEPNRRSRLSLIDAPDSTLLTVADVVTLYEVSKSYVYTLRSKIPSNSFGGLRFRKGDIERYLAAHQQQPTPRLNRKPTRSGTWVAKRPAGGDEIVPGLTRAALKAATGL